MTRYDSFLLRIWRRSDAEGEAWAGRLEHVQGGQSLRFTSPEALLSYLHAAIGRGDPHTVTADGASGHDVDGNVQR